MIDLVIKIFKILCHTVVIILPDCLLLKLSSSRAGGSEEGRGGGGESSSSEEDLRGNGEIGNDGGWFSFESDVTSSTTSVIDICPTVVSLTEACNWLLPVASAFCVTLGSSLMSETCVRDVELIVEPLDLRAVSLVIVVMVENR